MDDRRPAGRCAVCVAVFLYGSSWALFWNTGVFFDRQAFAFLALNPVCRCFHWVYPPLAIGGPRRHARCRGGPARWWVPGWICQPRSGSCNGGWSSRRAARWPSVSSLRSSARTGRTARRRRSKPATPSRLRRQPRRSVRPGSPMPSPMCGRAVRVLKPLLSRSTGHAQRHSPADRLDGPVPGRRSAGRRQALERRDGADRVAALGPACASTAERATSCRRSTRWRANPACSRTRTSRRAIRTTRIWSRCHRSIRCDRREMYEYPPNPTYPRVLIYDVLKALGYKTAIFSSQNERWGGMINFHRREQPGSLLPRGDVHRADIRAVAATSGFAEWVKETKGAGSVDDRYTVDEAIKWIDSVAGEPFFLHMNLQSSHVPYVVPDDFPRRFSPKKHRLRDHVGKVSDRQGRHRQGSLRGQPLLRGHADRASVRSTSRATACGTTRSFVIGGDNGEAFYEHGFAAHASSLFNEVDEGADDHPRAGARRPGSTSGRRCFWTCRRRCSQLLGPSGAPGLPGHQPVRARARPRPLVYMIVQTPRRSSRRSSDRASSCSTPSGTDDTACSI